MIQAIPVFFAVITLLLSSTAKGEYISVFSGYQTSEHSYLIDSSEQQGNLFGAKIDTHRWRRKPTGWWARGIRAEIKQGPNLLSINGLIPLYQWHKHQGTWLDIHWMKQDFQTTLSDAQTFLGNEGTETPLNPQSPSPQNASFNKLIFIG